MLEREQIALYREEITRAKTAADREIKTAITHARTCLCPGCDYCQALVRHTRVINQTFEELIKIVDAFAPGTSSSVIFPRAWMSDEVTLYQGFITDMGEYVPMYRGIDHSKYREIYAAEHGEERAHRMITIHARGVKTRVLISDRKHAPTEEQLKTLRELMIDARGNLGFHFELESNHPMR